MATKLTDKNIRTTTRETWTVGRLAQLAGTTIRTLRYYDEIGLLSPSGRSEGGYRLYDADDVVRLGQIQLLRGAGFSLDEAREFLSRAGVEPRDILRMRMASLKEQIARQQKLYAQLALVDSRLADRPSVPAEEFLKIMGAITMSEKYFTPDQLAELEERKQTVGEDRIRAVEEEWPRLIAQVKALMDAGEDPASEAVRPLAQRWVELVNEFTGGNPEIHATLARMYKEEQNIGGMDIAERQAMSDYIHRANQAACDSA